MSLINKASLVITPNAVKESKLYSVIPNTSLGDMSVVRATTATRVNSDGLVELVPYNLFVNSIWAGGGILPTSWVSNLTTGTSTPTTSIKNPNVTAYRFITSDTRRDFYQNFSIASNSVVCLSVYVEVVTVPIQVSTMLRISGGVGTGTSVFLKNNVVIPSNTNIEAGNIYTLQFTCIIADTTFSCRVGCGMLGNVTGDFVLSMPQLEQGSIPKPYFYTTNRLNVPRLNYDGGCPSILLEPQRTNLLINSVWGGTPTPTSWTKQSTGNTSPIASIKNPNVTAYNFNGVTVRGFFSQGFTFTNGITYAISIYVENVVTTNPISRVLLTANATGTSTYLKNNVAISVNSLIEAGNTYTLIYSATATSTGEIRVGLGTDGSVTGNFTLSMPQLEVGSYSTSYIPTVASTVTRNLDDISKINISSLLNPSEGTFYVEAQALSDDSTGRIISLSDSSDYNQIAIQFSNTNQIRVDTYGKTGPTTSTNFRYNLPVATTTSLHKIAIVWGPSGIFGFIDGAKYTLTYATGTIGGNAIPTNLTRLDFKAYWGGGPFFSKTKLVGVWKTALSDTEMIQLTTL